MPVAAVDWDGTLWVDGSFSPGAVDALRVLRRRGWRVTVFSCRCGYPEGREWLRRELDARGLSWVSVSSGKPRADVYIDDRAVRFEGDWPAVLRLVV